MPDPIAPVSQPSLINEPPVVPPVAPSPESLLFPETERPTEPKPAVPAAPVVPAKTEPTPESKPAEPKPGDPKPSTEPKAIVDYENLKLPDGSLLSADELAAVKKEAKDKGLTLEQAQGELTVRDNTIKAYESRQKQVLEVTEKQWRAEWANDPDFGGDKTAESSELAKRGADKFADPILREWLDKTRLGSFPPVMKLFARLGRLNAEDQLLRGTLGGTPKEVPPEERMYPSNAPKPE